MSAPWIALQASPPPPATDYSFFVMMGSIFLIFYFLVMRPQQRKQREHQDALKGIEKGDRVVTTGGLHGKVTGTADDVLTVEVAALKGGERVRVKIERARIERVEKAGEKGSGDKPKGKGDDS